MNQSDHNEYLQSCALKIPLPQPNYKSYHPIFCSGLFWIVLDCSGLFWIVLDCSGLFWIVLDCSGL